MAGYQDIQDFGEYVEMVHKALKTDGVGLLGPKPHLRAELTYAQACGPIAGSAIPGSVWTTKREAPTQPESLSLLKTHFLEIFPDTEPLNRTRPGLASEVVLDEGAISVDAIARGDHHIALCFRTRNKIVTTVIGFPIADQSPLRFVTVDPSRLLAP
jgi:hypothetical protein